MILAKTNIKKTNQIDNIVFAKGTPKIKRQEMVKIYDFVALMYGPAQPSSTAVAQCDRRLRGNGAEYSLLLLHPYLVTPTTCIHIVS